MVRNDLDILRFDFPKEVRKEIEAIYSISLDCENVENIMNARLSKIKSLFDAAYPKFSSKIGYFMSLEPGKPIFNFRNYPVKACKNMPRYSELFRSIKIDGLCPEYLFMLLGSDYMKGVDPAIKKAQYVKLLCHNRDYFYPLMQLDYDGAMMALNVINEKYAPMLEACKGVSR